MLDKLKKTIKHSVIYSFGNLSSKLIGLILIPLYTEYLSTEEYGIFAILEVTSQILVLFLGLNLGTALLRWCAAEKDLFRKKSIVFTVTTTSLAISILSLILLLPFAEDFSVLFFNHTNFSNYFTILFFTVVFGILNLIPMSLIRVEEKSTFFVIVTTIKFASILILNIYFVAFRKMGVEGIILGQLLGQLLFTIITLPFVVRNSVLKFDFPILKEMIHYSFPLVFSSLFTMLFSIGDRYLLRFLGSLSDVGIYSLGYKVSSFINVFIINSFQLGFLPLAFKYAEQSNSKRFFSKIQTYFSLALVITALFLSFFSLEFVKVFTSDKSYWEAYLIIPIINLAFVFKGMEYIFSITFHQMKVTKYNAVIVTLSLLVSLTLNFILIPLLGMYGTGISILATYFLMSFLSFYYSRQVYEIPYEKRKLLLLITSYIVLVTITFLFINDLEVILRVVLKFILLILFPVILYFFNFYEEIELLRIKQTWQKWRNPKNWKKNFSDIKL